MQNLDDVAADVAFIDLIALSHNLKIIVILLIISLKSEGGKSLILLN